MHCARPALAIFEDELPGDGRPRAAVDAAYAFADGSAKTKALHDRARDAQRAAQQARDAGQPAAAEPARAALAAAGAAFLHPWAKASQVKHILGASAHAARAFGISAKNHPAVGLDGIARARALAAPHLADVLERYSPAPSGGGRVGELMRILDASLRRPQAQQVLTPTRCR